VILAAVATSSTPDLQKLGVEGAESLALQGGEEVSATLMARCPGPKPKAF